MQLIHGMKVPSDHSLMALEELAYLVDAARGSNVIEIGSFRGASAEAMLKGGVLHLTCIDPHADMWWGDDLVLGKEVQAEFLQSLAKCPPNWDYIQDYSDNAVDKVKHNGWCYNMLFVDGLHTYDQCLRDLQNYVPLLNSFPKYVIVHDYCITFSGVVAATIRYFNAFPTKIINTLAIYEIRGGESV